MTNTTPPEELHSWKEIAAYLRISVREAQYREKNDGLPVHRGIGKKPHVWAVRSEIDHWKLSPLSGESRDAVGTVSIQEAGSVSQHPFEATPSDRGYEARLTRRVVSGVVLSGGLAGFFALTKSFRAAGNRKPFHAAVNGNVLSVVDGANQLVWTHIFERPLVDLRLRAEGTELTRLLQVVPLDHSGAPHVLLAARFNYPDGDPSEAVHSDQLLCFAPNGELQWRYKPNITLTMGSTKFDGPWHITDMQVATNNSTTRIWIAVVHWNWFPGLLIALDVHGVGDVRFVSGGHFYAIKCISVASGHYILAGGVNNEYRSAALAIVRDEAPVSCSPHTPGSQFGCADIPNIAPHRYFVFPPTDVCLADGLPYNAVRRMQSVNDINNVFIREVGHGQDGSAIYEVSSNLELASRAFDDSWAAAHRRLEQTGVLRHALAQCPLLRHPGQVRRWTVDSGWTRIEVPLKQGLLPK